LATPNGYRDIQRPALGPIEETRLHSLKNIPPVRNFFPSSVFTGRAKRIARRKPMIAWATIITLVTGAIAYVSSDLSSMFTGLAELGGVTVLFALVCAAEAYN
jgi:hypothetical protein